MSTVFAKQNLVAQSAGLAAATGVPSEALNTVSRGTREFFDRINDSRR